MATSTKRPNSISQTTGKYATGKYYRSWSSLSNLKGADTFADCGIIKGSYIGGKNGTYPRPAPLKLTNFKFSVPSTAKISKITVYYRHYKPKINGAYPNIAAPTIDLLNVSASAKKGSAVPTSSTEYSVSWAMSPSVSKVNSSSFGVSINYPANSNTNPGQVRLRDVRIVITYTTTTVTQSSSSSSSNTGTYISSDQINAANGRIIVVGSDGSISYADNNSSAVESLTTLSTNISQTGASVSKSKAFPGESVDIIVSLSSSSKITAAVPMYISIPTGVEFLGKKSGNGTIIEGISNEMRSGETHTWVANFNNSTSCSIVFTVKINAIGVQTFSFREGTTDKQSAVKITSVLPPAKLRVGEYQEVLPSGEDAELTFIYSIQDLVNTVNLSSFELPKQFTVTFPSNVTVTWDDSDFTVTKDGDNHHITTTLTAAETSFQCNINFPDVGKYIISIVDDNDDSFSLTIKVKPQTLTMPYFAKIVANEHVTDRLGNSKEYVLSSLMKLVTEQEYEDLIESYDYNYRLGVFNTILPEDYPQNSETQNPNLSDSSLWKELEGRNMSVTIEDDAIKGNSVCVFGSNTEFINKENYTLTFNFYTSIRTRTGFLLFGNPSSRINNKCSWYGIITDITGTFIEGYDEDGTASKLYNASENYFQDGDNKVKVIRENDSAQIYINGRLFYTINELTNCKNTVGFQKWGGGSAAIENLKVDLSSESLNKYLFENAEWSEPIHEANQFEDIQVSFAYSEDYPLIFLIAGEYIEANAEEISLEYTYPCLIEKEYRDNAELPGIYGYPIKNSISDTLSTTVDLEKGEVTNISKLYDIDLSNFLESDEDNRVIQGVSVFFDVLTCDNPISIMCKLSSPSFIQEGVRSVNIESAFLENDIFQGIVSLGGKFDLWGLDFDDFKLSSLENLTIDLQFLNNFEQTTHLEYNNLRVVFYYVELEESIITGKVNGVDLRYFNVFLQNVTIKQGTNNDVKYLDVEGTDANLAYRSNIREKEIEMEIRVPGCDIEETTAFVERLAIALANKRNKFNKPILNEIEFSHYPNRVWRYILEDELDLSAEYTEYEGKIKLVVPEGTAYSKEVTITNASGTNAGIAKVNPIIRVIAQGTTIIVKETASNQQWVLNDDTLEVGDIIRIDCRKRKAYKIQGADDAIYTEDLDDTPDIDITSKVDFNSDWFLIQGDYNFECDNTAIIQAVMFNERW